MAKRASSSIVGGLISLLVLVMGVSNWWGNRSLVTYHNDFVQGSYHEVVMGAWLQLLDKIKSDNPSDEDVAKILSDTFIPATKKWVDLASKEVPPTYAEDFHNRYVSGLGVLAKDGEKLLKAIENEDKDAFLVTFKHTDETTAKLIDEVVKLQEQLKKDRQFTFKNENEKKEGS